MHIVVQMYTITLLECLVFVFRREEPSHLHDLLDLYSMAHLYLHLQHLHVYVNFFAFCVYQLCVLKNQNLSTFIIRVFFPFLLDWSIAEDLNIFESPLDVIISKFFNLNSNWVLFTFCVTVWHGFWVSMVWVLQMFQVIKC